MKIRPKNFGQARIPLKTILTIVGHGGSNCPIVQQHPIINSIYAIIVTSLYCVAFGFILDFGFKTDWLNPEEKEFLYSLYAIVVIVGLSRILSWYYAKIHVSFTEKVVQVDETLQKCGSSLDHTKDFNLSIASIGIGLITFSVFIGREVIWPANDMPIYQILLVSCVLYHPIHLSSIIVCNFSLEVWLIGERFRKANKILEKVINPLQQPITDQAWTFLGDTMDTSTLVLSPRRFLNDGLRRQHVIQIIKHVHLELCAISKELNRVHGLEMALTMAMHFLMITRRVTDSHDEFVVSSENINLEPILHYLPVCAYFGEVMLVNQACEKVSAEAERTGQIIHSINKSNENPEFGDEIKQFSLQLIQHPLHFSPAGLFILGSKFVVKFIAAVVTFATIFIQIWYQFHYDTDVEK